MCLLNCFTQEKRVTSACYCGLPHINLWAVEMRSIAVFISMQWLCCLRLAIRSDSSWPSERLMTELSRCFIDENILSDIKQE